MTDLIGALAKASILPATTWGTAVQAGAGHQFEIYTPGFGEHGPEMLRRLRETDGSIQPRSADAGKQTFKLNPQVPAKFETLDFMIAAAFGTAANGVQQGSDTAYLHRLTIANNLAGIFGTGVLVPLAGEEVWEYDSVKITGFRFDWMTTGDGQVCKFTFYMVARKLSLNTSSGTNTTTTAASITMLSPRNRILTSQCVVRLNDQTAGALDSNAVQKVKAGFIEMKRLLKEDDFNTSGGGYIDEPTMNGKCEVRLGLTFSKYATANKGRMADRLAATEKKADVVFTGGIANGSTNYKLSWYLNCLQFEPGAPGWDGAGVSDFTLEAGASAAASSPTGFPSSTTGQLTAELINTKSTNALTNA